MNENSVRGNPPELKQIARDYGRMVSFLCTRMISNPQVAEEAAQETWLEITRSLNSFRNQSKISTWIYTITRRVVIRYSQRGKLYSTDYLRQYFRSDEPAPDFPNDRREYARHIKEQCDKCMVEILHCLDNDSRLAYIMRDIAGLSYGDISDILEKSEPAVRKEISRSRNKLRRFLHEECYLFNPEGNCKCRMKDGVKEINLDQEFDRLRQTVHKMHLFKEAEKSLPRKNFWEKFLN
ncbi:MAG: RNA polymerase sigma factor [Deltaproteobacteria bacterium]|nr:RNA polymerase sigma factor [Deltaproteobacteria bacterium]